MPWPGAEPESRASAADAGTPTTAHYWEHVGRVWQRSHPHALWRAHSDAVNVSLFSAWLPHQPIDRLLKTDLFDEAFGEGFFTLLAARARRVVGIDLAGLTAAAASVRHGTLQAIAADVRQLPFPDATLDVIVSNSTLDHFATRQDVDASLRELRRVLRPGGSLLLTMDNLDNPFVALRNAIPFALLSWLGLVPYYVGATYGSDGLRRAMRAAGLQVCEVRPVMHCPRIVAVALARLVQRFAGPRGRDRFLGVLMRFERLSLWPTRDVTGYLVAVRAIRP